MAPKGMEPRKSWEQERAKERRSTRVHYDSYELHIHLPSSVSNVDGFMDEIEETWGLEDFIDLQLGDLVAHLSSNIPGVGFEIRKAD